MKRAVEVATRAALEAGTLLREEFNRVGGPRGSHGHAEVDTHAEQLIVDSLKAAFPADAILGEELGRHTPSCWTNNRVWLIDPNDGTSTWLQGIRGAAVSIALLENCRPVLGIVFAHNAPTDQGDLFIWAEGQPLMRNGDRFSRSWPSKAPRDMVALVSCSARSQNEQYRCLPGPLTLKPAPSIAWRLARVAAGDADLAVTLNSPDSYDLAGGHALLIGAGGELYDEQGEPVRYQPDGRLHSFSSAFYGGARKAI